MKKMSSTVAAATNAFPMSHVINKGVKKDEKRAAFRQDTLRAWEEYRRTGAHLTGEEMDAWMAKLESGEDADLPRCSR